MNYLLLIALVILFICTASVAENDSETGPAMKSLADHQSSARHFNAILQLPAFETTSEAVRKSIDEAIREADAALDVLGQLRPEETRFRNTVRELDDIKYQAGLTAARVYLIKETNPDEKIRRVATEKIKEFQEWSVGVEYRMDVYQAVKAFAETEPALEGEELKLLEETMRDYRRSGLALPQDKRLEVEEMRKRLSQLATDFRSQVTNAEKSLKFSRAELEGVPETFFSAPGVKTGDDEYSVQANVTWHFVSVMENARREDVRRRLKSARFTLAQDQNAGLLNQVIALRNQIAHRLGYASWADYQIEPRMAKDGQTATDFLTRLKDGLEPKFDAEIEIFRRLKARDTDNPEARIEMWDWRYYDNQYKKENFSVDAEKLRDFFAYRGVLGGMFRIYERIFALKIESAAVPYKWWDDVELYVVSDSGTGEPLGAFYLDMFPREGKFNHFAQFTLVSGKELPDGVYRRPVVALICNFPSPSLNRPSLLSHSQVETLFHEFGHALHSIMTRARFNRFSGTSVPRDFVEAPSQMLENWVWDKEVLDTFAADYQDPSRRIPADILRKMDAARLATIGTFYRRQLSFGLLDLHLHRNRVEGESFDAVSEANAILSRVFLPVPEGTTFATYFGHLMGYDAGYYGYAWADAIAADMNTVFEEAPRRYFDTETGRRLRDEIYAPGDSRDVNISIREFLGRERSIEPFLKSIGIADVPAG